MDLLLTSDGLTHEDIKGCFVEQINMLANKKIAVLYTVKEPGDEEWLTYRKAELSQFDFKYDFINISEDTDLSQKLFQYGIIYVCGGNTFYILNRIRKTGIDKFLKNSLEKPFLYVGLSAGSIILGPDIEVAGIEPKGDQNDIELEELEGLNVIPLSIYPHYEEIEKPVVEKYFQETGKSIITLNNYQAIFVKNGEYKLLGDQKTNIFGVPQFKFLKHNGL